MKFQREDRSYSICRNIKKGGGLLTHFREIPNSAWQIGHWTQQAKRIGPRKIHTNFIFLTINMFLRRKKKCLKLPNIYLGISQELETCFFSHSISSISGSFHGCKWTEPNATNKRLVLVKMIPIIQKINLHSAALLWKDKVNRVYNCFGALLLKWVFSFRSTYVCGE